MKTNKLIALFCFISALLTKIQGAEPPEMDYVRTSLFYGQFLNTEQKRQESLDRLRRALSGDMAWQILDNFKILPENVKVREIPYRQSIDILIFSEPKFLNKNIWLGIFHPDPLVRDSEGNAPICKRIGGWGSFWPMRLSRIRFNDLGEPTFTTIHPHQLHRFDLSRRFKDIPFCTDPREVKDIGFWSLIIDNEGLSPHEAGFNESHRAFATFHRLVDN